MLYHSDHRQYHMCQCSERKKTDILYLVVSLICG